MQHSGLLKQVPVIVLEVQNSLDSSNYNSLIKQAREVLQAGNQHLAVEMGNTSTISTFGVFALCTIISLWYDKPLPVLEQCLSKAPELPYLFEKPSRSQHLLILNPQPHIAQALYSLGVNHYAEILVSA